jgi:hypothetical protein
MSYQNSLIKHTILSIYLHIIFSKVIMKHVLLSSFFFPRIYHRSFYRLKVGVNDKMCELYKPWGITQLHHGENDKMTMINDLF